MKTRKDLLEKRCTHREYYEQFVTPATRHSVLHAIGIDRLMWAYKNGEGHLNEIPLREWDAIPTYWSVKKLKEAGDFTTMAAHVCVVKEAARQLIDHELEKEKAL